jgi:hypothetical protein
MKRYIVIDKDTLEQKKVIRQIDYNLANGIGIALIALLAFLFIDVVVIRFLEKREWKKEKTEMLSAHVKTVDSLQSIIDSAETVILEYNLHAKIGKLYIRRGEHTPCSKDSVWKLLEEINPWYPEYIMAQCIQESGCGKNQLDGYNMFGMTLSSGRETTAYNVGSGDKYSKYKNWELGVIDRVLWEINIFGHRKPSRDTYVASLKRYAEDPEYIGKIESIAKCYR